MFEDVRLKTAQPGTRIQSQLLSEEHACPAQHREGVALAAGAVQREGQQPPGLLARRVISDVRVQVGYRLGGTSQGQPCLGRALHGVQPQLAQAGAVRTGPALLGEVGVGGAAPPSQSLFQRGRRMPRRLGRGRGHRLLEPPGVHRARRCAQRVPRPLGDQQPGRRTGRAASACGSSHRSSTRRLTGTMRRRATINLAGTARCRGPLKAIAPPARSQVATGPSTPSATSTSRPPFPDASALVTVARSSATHSRPAGSETPRRP